MHVVDATEIARTSDDFRRELATGTTTQLVAMKLEPGEEIGEEVHEDGDQIVLIVEGEGEAVLDGERAPLRAGQAVVIPGGTRHNVINAGSEPLRLLTVYAPPEHEPGTVHATKAEADAADHHH